MKNHYVSPLYILFFALFFSGTLMAQGPDDFGYTWKDSNDPEGPVFDWIDITSIGTEVEGLGDDNSVGPFDMGMDFRFYWYDVNQIKIGSNGWLSFDNVSNIASCFPPLPTANSANNLICPLMSDINFANGSAGKMYTYLDNTPGEEKYIISYENASHWTAGNATFGSNTFQVILSKADNSITFQYASMEPDFDYSCTGAGKIGVGMENLTGEIGLQVLEGVMPPSDYVIRFEYPEEITLSIFDVAPTANQNPDNEGVFVLPNETITLTTTVSNTGNTDIDTEIEVLAEVLGVLGEEAYSELQTLPGLTQGSSEDVNFVDVPTDWNPGSYFFNSYTANSQDINAGNDINTTEINVLDLSADTTTMGYYVGENPTGVIQWSGGGDGTSGGGIEIEPPFYPAIILSFQVGIAAGSTDGFTVKLFDDDGPNGGPGTEINSRTVLPEEYLAGALNSFEFENPNGVTDGSFYVGWFMDGPTVALLVEANGPLSNRGYEVLANAWGKYRNPADLYLSVALENPFFVKTDDIVEDDQLEIFPNPNNGTFQIDNTLGQHTLEQINLIDVAGALVLQQKQFVRPGEKLDIQTNLAKGLYFLEMWTKENKRIVKKVSIQ